MTTLDNSAKHKAALKKSRPQFIRQGARNIKRLSTKWRKPRGFQSKMRRYKKGKPKMASIGYKSPRVLQNVLSSGFRERLVSNLKDLQAINPKKELAVLSSSVGKRKTILIVNEAKKLGVSFSNIKPEEKIKQIQEFLASRKQAKTTKQKHTKKKDKELEEKEKNKETKKDSAKKTSKSAEKEGKKSSSEKNVESKSKVNSKLKKPKTEAQKK